MPQSLIQQIYQIADELRASASIALHFETNEYVVDRFRRVLAASARLVAAVEGSSAEETLRQFEDHMFHASPLVGAEAVVVRGAEILLMRRKKDGLWALPGGLAEVGENLTSAVERELFEETNVRAHVVKLLGIFDSRSWGSLSKFQFYLAIFQMEGEELSPSSGSEALEVGFFSADQLPPLSPGHELRIPFVFQQLRGEQPIPYFDRSDL